MNAVGAEEGVGEEEVELGRSMLYMTVERSFPLDLDSLRSRRILGRARGVVWHLHSCRSSTAFT